MFISVPQWRVTPRERLEDPGRLFIELRAVVMLVRRRHLHTSPLETKTLKDELETRERAIREDLVVAIPNHRGAVIR
ncbi:hypothetical protein A4W93_21690 [Piscinibacter gummiphilus]|uniref:Uncharacterized protein n=1 Tax=Piscinibacter gummiphilus TaxID=946333 RepID=A0A1W6LDF4_9BURK|nr:hypothetical protein A4W93_21690 [Piscinibacter gummiphilus]